mmetsp:Transcript_26731/g.72556  ORF Transcript_26731/g.72556 Transcript_26731/m.72556 type:complete len:202 (-) Transcript_26731:102-707(-)
MVPPKDVASWFRYCRSEVASSDVWPRLSVGGGSDIMSNIPVMPCHASLDGAPMPCVAASSPSSALACPWSRCTVSPSSEVLPRLSGLSWLRRTVLPKSSVHDSATSSSGSSWVTSRRPRPSAPRLMVRPAGPDCALDRGGGATSLGSRVGGLSIVGGEDCSRTRSPGPSAARSSSDVRLHVGDGSPVWRSTVTVSWRGLRV